MSSRDLHERRQDPRDQEEDRYVDRNEDQDDEDDLRILVVDDNRALRRSIRGILEQNRHWTVCGEAQDGRDALVKLDQLHPDLVLMDFQMPEMNGLEAARAISLISPKTPILMLTLYPSDQLADEARKAGASAALAKTDMGSVVNAVAAVQQNLN